VIQEDLRNYHRGLGGYKNILEASELVLTCVESCCCDMIFESSTGEDIEDFYLGNKMSKVLMKLRLKKNINRQIQIENYELRMQLQDLEEDK